jgi:D-alanyl-D-alanine carboxypeptidase
VVVAGAALALGALLGVADRTDSGPVPHPHAATKAKASAAPRSGYATERAARQVSVHLKLPLRSGLLFDVNTGRVLWERGPEQALPIASLTKMMTALVVASHTRAAAQVLITPQAVHFSGSGVGLLPLHKRVPVETLLYGLLLPSGNDAAIALAQHVAGTEAGFIALMNAEATRMGLRCTHFTTASGIVDQGNYSCATDLATVARAVLREPLLARIVGSRSVALPFPIKGGKLYLYNNNPLLLMRYPGADGVKTGYTVAAGQCLVATARRGARRLGVVLLGSKDPPDQAQRLLNAGFAS